jgi:hypothetical protein
MNSQDFLLLNVAWVSIFVLWYWRSRGNSSIKPTKLNMHAPDSAPLIIPPEGGSTPGGSAAFPGGSAVASMSALSAKNLNVIFNYNGHSWDAYEVLGVPAGSQLRDVTAAYQQALRTADPVSHGFLETAYKAILHRF